ncbi:hypothetical protein GALMADRAFT_146693 [Galerina marginata CBS 339.88]|uniref:non-specific serine/threonine protein kinase n=1 Tax=Galerina marginata (strain CBS 339.88) TaxID=685588 RepID=A0A067SMJ3_GALM3|nr:hypothetical protein GALMADRAFT_146693 [Galerina marginata CBS 339.88]
MQLPPDDNPRAPDGFSYSAYGTLDENRFFYGNSKMHAARARDNRDVVIVLLSDGVTGVNAVEALQLVASGVALAIDRNHALPVLQFLRHDKFTFGVFPLVGSYSTLPWFNYMEEALEFMCQILEGVAFLHDHRVAHRDLFTSNFLTSRRNGRVDPEVVHEANQLVRWRYYIIDFEWAVHFSPDSDPAECTVIGPPSPWSLYARPSPPEMRSNLAYCPFKADVWQLGSTFLRCFRHLEGIPEIVNLLQLMRADHPGTRPTARNAVERLNSLRGELPSSILRQPIEENDEEDDAQ